MGEQMPVAQFGGGGAPRPRHRWQGVEGSWGSNVMLGGPGPEVLSACVGSQRV